MAFVGLVPLIRSNAIKPVIDFIIFTTYIVLTPIYLNVQADPVKPKRNLLFISSFAFVVWAYAISGKQIIPDYYDPAVASVVLILFSLISGGIPLNK